MRYGYGYGYSLGSAQGGVGSDPTRIWNYATAASEISFRIKVKDANQIVTASGADISLTSGSGYGTSVTIPATVAYPGDSTDTTIYIKASASGALKFPDYTKITYLYTTSTGITGVITGMPLTYLRLGDTGTSITGVITGMALTYLRLTGNVTSITGVITGMPLTYLYLIGAGTAITGVISGMSLTLLILSGVGTAIAYSAKLSCHTGMTSNNALLFETGDDGDNNPTPPTITFLTGGNNKSFGITRGGVDITVQLATDGSGVSTTTANDIIAGWNQGDITISLGSGATGTGIVPAMTQKILAAPLGAIGTVNLSANSIQTAAEYRAIMQGVAANVASLTALTFFETDIARCPSKTGANDLAGNQQVSTALTAILAKVPAAAISTQWKAVWGI